MKSRFAVIVYLLAVAAASAAHAQERYYLSQVANGGFDGGTFRTTFVLFNNTDQDTTALLELTDDNGDPFSVTIPGLGTDSEFGIFLAGGTTRILQTDGSGPLTAGAAVVTAPASIGVSAIFTIYDAAGDYLTEAGVGSSAPSTEFVLPVDTTGLFNTGLALFNTGSGSAAITMELHGTNGQAAGQVTLNLGEKEHIARFIAGQGQLFPSLGSFQGTLRVASDVPLAALVLRQNQSPLSYTSLPVVPVSSSKTSQNLAQVANGAFDGGRFRTSFLLFNLSSGTANVVLSLTKSDGSPFSVTIEGRGTGHTFSLPLAARASVFLQTDGSGSLTAGAATITSTAPIGASAIFTVLDRQGAFQTEAGVGDSPLLTALTLPVDVTGSFDTGVAFFNPQSSPATLTLRLLNGNGEISADSRTINLAGKNHTAQFVTGIFPGTANFRGSMTVVATSGVAALTLRQNSSPLSYTTLPVAAGFASGKPPQATLLPKTLTGLTVTADITVDETLTPGYRLTGQAGKPGQAREVVARRTDGSLFYGEVDSQAGRYLTVLPEGSYSLQVCYQAAAASGSGSVTMTFSDPAMVQVIGDTAHDISLPSAALFSVSGSVSGLTGLPSTTGASLVFISGDNTVEGDFALGSDGRYQGSLPSGNYRASLSIPFISHTPFQNQSLSLYNLGPASISGAPVVADYSLPPAARVSGTVRAGWLGSLAFGIGVTASDRSAPQLSDATCILPPAVSSANADPTGQYQMVLASGRSYAMEVAVPLLDGTRRLGSIGYPVTPGELNLTGDTGYDFNLPAIPGRVTISGRISDGGGAGLKGITVAAFGRGIVGAPELSYTATAITDSNGNYSLTVLSGTGYQMIFIPPAPVP